VDRRATPAAFGQNVDAGPDRAVLLDVEVDGMRYRLVRSEANVPPPAMLSPREQEICRMVAQGHPNKTIAAVLEISSWTVGTYLRRLFAKLNVGSRAAMIAKLMQEGRLSNPAPHILIPTGPTADMPHGRDAAHRTRTPNGSTQAMGLPVARARGLCAQTGSE
jgi:DNA-binding CsgD family transcriptional regulator